MNKKQREKVAGELVRLAKDLVSATSIDDLSASEQKIAQKMKDKGYSYVAQIVTVDGDFGEPLYFKSSGEVGPFLRSFPDYKKAKTKWNFKL
jgi:hypothetical protein